MARVTNVKKAQQRYATVPLLDGSGNQKTTPVLRSDGSPKTDKKGHAIVRRLTTEDKTKPLPNHTCDKCRKEITVGSPYKWIAPKSGPYGGTKRYRCGECPTWEVWEYSSSLSARISQITADFDVSEAESKEEVEEALNAIAEQIKELAEEKREGASNIEDGFGHATSMSDELNETADNLDSWADEIEQVDVPDYPEPEEGDCEECGGTGKIEVVQNGSSGIMHSEETCEACNGEKVFTPDEPTEDQIDEWRSEVEDACSIVNESPV